MKFFSRVRVLFLFAFIFVNFELRGAENEIKDANQLWKSLERGNNKFISNKKYAKQRRQTAHKQNPRIAILGCSDSRVPPEIIFDHLKIGLLFTTRSAGQVVDAVVADSIEYTIRTHDTNLLVVLGHTDCGAVVGALKRLRANGGVPDKPGPGQINAVLIPIEIGIVQAGIDIYGPHALEQSIKANVRYQTEQLLNQSPHLIDEINHSGLVVKGALYNMKSGKVKELFTIKNHYP